METETATTLLGALSSGRRLDVFRLLGKRGVRGMVAGDIATALAMAPSNLSFHLKALAQAGLVTAAPEGRFQRYRANLRLMRDLTSYLREECCGGRPETRTRSRTAARRGEVPARPPRAGKPGKRRA